MIPPTYNPPLHYFNVGVDIGIQCDYAPSMEKKKGGRPLTAEEPRSKCLSSYYTPAEFLRVLSEAGKRGAKVGTTLRELVLESLERSTDGG